MITGAAADEKDSFCVFKGFRDMLHDGLILPYCPLNGLRLLHDLLEHEMVELSFFGMFNIPLNRVDGPVNLHSIGKDAKAIWRRLDDIVVIEINDVFCVLEEGGNVR